MKFNNPHTVLWDEMDTLRREDFPLQFPSELTSQVAVNAQGDDNLVTALWQAGMPPRLLEELGVEV